MASSSQLKQNQRSSRNAHERFQSYASSKREGKVKEGRNRDRGDEIQIPWNTLEPTRREEGVRKGSSKRDDELVRYMSKLPGYLQREERGESFQGKALNVGVLDWGRLEKWKHGNKGDPATTTTGASSSGINMSEKAKTKVSHRHKIDERFYSSRKDETSRDLHCSVQKSRRSREPELVSGVPLNKQKKAICGHEFSGRDRVIVDPWKSRTHSSHKFNSLAARESALACNGDTKKKVERKIIPEAKQRVPCPVIDSDIGASSMRSRKCSTSPDLGEKQSVKIDGAKMIAEESQNLEAGASRQHGSDSSNVVLPRHRKHNTSVVLEEPQMILDGIMGEAKQSNFSTDFANGTHHSSKLRSQIPCPYPLSLDFEKDSGSSVLSPGVDLSSDACKKNPFGRKHLEAGCIGDAESSGTVYQEKSEEESGKSRHPSPVRRFSFSFSRLSRSFSFKEYSAALPLSSDEGIKSGPVRLEGSVCPDGSIQPQKLNHSRARASPLKRLLDPLRKPKSTGKVPSSKERPTSSNLKPINSDEPLQDERMQDMSTTRAFVQLNIRNGLTLFRFVVDDNSNSILMATMKTSALSSKDYSVQYCTFYSVNEVKKKSGSWLIHGNKEKQCGFAYNTVGQMRLSNSFSSDSTEESFRNFCPVRESVLFEFELRHSDQETKKIRAGTELAAVVINGQSQKSSSEAPKNKSTSMTPNALGDDGDASGTTTIILPSGVHSFPNKGAPSPLIDRWRSGGLCDCGGWDIGCKLRVLSNQRCFHGFLSASKPQLPSFQLFYQEGTQQNTPAFMMTLLKNGIYSVEFSSSISPLQAFFICVTVITCDSEQQSDDSEFSTPSEPGAPEDAVTKPEDHTKNRQMPVRYPPFNPPLSPVGRV